MLSHHIKIVELPLNFNLRLLFCLVLTETRLEIRLLWERFSSGLLHHLTSSFCR